MKILLYHSNTRDMFSTYTPLGKFPTKFEYFRGVCGTKLHPVETVEPEWHKNVVLARSYSFGYILKYPEVQSSVDICSESTKLFIHSSKLGSGYESLSVIAFNLQ